ncbi:MAG: hypothetical protein JXA87_07750 [Thermoleophilia bacterium]|nr:hypothetical protein [Thermoleophilia bacterium]
MGLMDRLTAGVERLAEGADKAIDKGKAKVGELQMEMQMDGLAKKLGYLVFDFYRGRQVDQNLRQKILDDMTRLEDQLLKAKAEAAAKAQAEAAWRAERDAQAAQAPVAAQAPGATQGGSEAGEAEPEAPQAASQAPEADASVPDAAAEVWPGGEDRPTAGV